MVAELLNRKTLVVSITVTSDFSKVREDGRVAFSQDAQQFGGHAVCIVGYDPATQEFKFANSWGDGGFGYISKSDLERILKYTGTISL
jgi:C1A family cysteine protease